MTTVSAQFKVHASFNIKQLMKAKISVQALKGKEFRTLFELTAQDIVKLFNRQQIKRKRR